MSNPSTDSEEPDFAEDPSLRTGSSGRRFKAYLDLLKRRRNRPRSEQAMVSRRGTLRSLKRSLSIAFLRSVRSLSSLLSVVFCFVLLFVTLVVASPMQLGGLFLTGPLNVAVAARFGGVVAGASGVVGGAADGFL